MTNIHNIFDNSESNRFSPFDKEVIVTVDECVFKKCCKKFKKKGKKNCKSCPKL